MKQPTGLFFFAIVCFLFAVCLLEPRLRREVAGIVSSNQQSLFLLAILTHFKVRFSEGDRSFREQLLVLSCRPCVDV